ncbi:MAG: CRISPR-associated endonuclease Cas2 [Rickettsiales bacterium]|jgi:CRISPR-associated protein Cas2|nr:CRISPR-associated endonuclease Cas2 [Rickettsiales bacterium]
MQRKYLILLIYDISDDKRRYRISKKIEGYGFWVQRSAYECHLTNNLYDKLLTTILPLFDFGRDMLRVYKLTESVEIKTFGNIPATKDNVVIII